MSLFQRVADALSIQVRQVQATAHLLDEGATVPFIARYRKEATGGLSDEQLRDLTETLTRFKELDERRASILKSLTEQGVLTEELNNQIQAAESRTRLEDLYLPFRPKRQTRAQKAIEAGLEPLADALWAGEAPQLSDFVCDAYPEDALEKGARDIIAERLSVMAQLRDWTRKQLNQQGVIRSQGELAEDSKFKDYADFAEPLSKIASHRAMALFRGRDAGELSLAIQLETPEGVLLEDLGRLIDAPKHPFAQGCLRWAWRTKLLPQIEGECLANLWQRAEDDALGVFQQNLHDLLMAAPAGTRPTLGLDPGIRTGVKGTVLNAQGDLLAHATLFPLEPKRDERGFIAQIQAWVDQYQLELIAVGNGTGGRETLDLVEQALSDRPQCMAVSVSESGASVYSASPLASREFPDLDVSYRGAVSIARRLMDPLAELVKIDPKALGVGQYQHDVNQTRLGQRLEQVVERCVNQVGVDLNTASPQLLQQVAGVGPVLAEAIVSKRSELGGFSDREQLKSVRGLGPKAFEQCAGFLRIRAGSEPLDASAVHPESYAIARQILTDLQIDSRALPAPADRLNQLNRDQYDVGAMTLKDLLEELAKPGRDPRGEFVQVKFDAGVRKVTDLSIGMKLPGIVTNVTDFGAFVDIGVKQDGLVHISKLAKKFLKHPSEAVKTGQSLEVWVQDVDIKRSRISLSAIGPASDEPKTERAHKQHRAPKRERTPVTGNAMAAAFSKAKR